MDTTSPKPGTNAYARLQYQKHKPKVLVRQAAWRAANPERLRQLHLKHNKKNNKTIKARAARRICSYRKEDTKKGFDASLNITTLQFLAIVSNPCIYCGVTSTEVSIGLDRIDNSKGHALDNVSPCCYECNTARNNRFTVQEMKDEIGPAIGRVRENRVLRNSLTMAPRSLSPGL